MLLLRILLFPISLLYGVIAQMRMWAFDWGIFKTTSFNKNIISIGNIKVGGTGKTPLTRYIARILSDSYSVALLSRGYGRKTKGYRLVTKNDAVENVGDEVYMMRQALSDSIPMAVAEARVVGATELFKSFPNIDVLLLDDAYQHRYIDRNCNILITEYNDLFSSDFYMPSGRLREWRTGAMRASLVVVSKCPTTIDKQNVEQSIRPYLKKNTPIFYSSIVYGAAIDKKQQTHVLQSNDTALVVTGIANSTPFVSYLKTQTNVVKHFEYKDHFNYTFETIQAMESFAKENNIHTLITTEKDWVKIQPLLTSSTLNWIYVPIEIHLNGEESLFKETILRTFVS